MVTEISVNRKFIRIRKQNASRNRYIITLNDNTNSFPCVLVIGKTKHKQETLHVVTIAMICFMLALLWKFQYFQRLIYKPVKWKGTLKHKLRTFGIVILNTKSKDCKSRKNLCTENFTYTKTFYLHEIPAVDLSKIYFLKNAKKTCKPNNRDWITHFLLKK